MNNVKWQYVEPLKNSLVIEQFEKKYNVILPISFKKIVKQFNAGYPTPNYCKIPGFYETDVKMLLSFNEEDPETIYDVIDFFLRKSHNKLIPFASDSGSGYFCFKGELVVYVVDESFNQVTIASNFEEFLNNLF